MGVIAALALLRVHVLVIELPGRPLLRLRAEAAVRARGWVVTADPEDTDLVLVCGTPRPDIVAAVEALWRRVPMPRARRTVRTAEELPAALDSAARVLADTALQRRAAATVPPPPGPTPVGPTPPGPTPPGPTPPGPTPAVPTPAVPTPAVPTPVGRLGPLLPDWPAGLIVECTVDVQGRVATAGIDRIPAEREDDPTGLRAFVLPIADAARLLRLAAWRDAALRLDGVVDRALAGAEPERLRRRLRSVARAVERSVTLRWFLAREAADLDVPDRVVALLTAAANGTAPPAPPARDLLGRPVAALPLLVAATEGVATDA